MADLLTIVLGVSLLGLLPAATAQSTDSLPYYQIPDYPPAYTAPAVAARMIDGLGFRYYWATEGLREEDLSYRPGTEARSTAETLEHIHGLTQIIANAIKQVPNSREESPQRTFEEVRTLTLQLLKEASDQLKATEATTMEEQDMVFGEGESRVSFPFWNLINGPVADALSHVGQVVSFRRSSGNPVNPRASVLLGKVVE